MRNPFADSYHWSKRIWAPNPFVVLLRKAQTDLAIRIWTIHVPIRSKKPEKNGFGPFSYKFFVCIRVGLTPVFMVIKSCTKILILPKILPTRFCFTFRAVLIGTKSCTKILNISTRFFRHTCICSSMRGRYKIQTNCRRLEMATYFFLRG